MAKWRRKRFEKRDAAKWGAAALGIGVLWLLLFRVNHFFLEVRPVGEDRVSIEYGERYTEQGARAYFCGSLLLKNGIPLRTACIPSGEVREGTVGSYTRTYSADFFFWHGEGERLVTVTDSVCPEITLTPDGPAVPGEPYKEAGYYAVDNYDGNITGRVVRTEEVGFITYAVVDSSGNPAYARREIPVYDGLAPEITLTGGQHMTIPVGFSYEEPGYSASDNVDGDLTDQVETEGEVEWYRAGNYEISYTVRDFQGNEGKAVRRVEVSPQARPETVEPQEKTIYLTFDDGPGPYTDDLLDILDKYGAKATFFVTDSGYPELLREIVERGHAIGIHTVTHDYAAVYADPQAFFEDLYGMQKVIYDQTGVKTTLMRFPGGSSNTVSRKTCEGIMSILTEAVQDAGFQYFDWNVDSGDAGGAKKTAQVATNVTYGIGRKHTCIVLQHDIHPYSVGATETILRWGRENGYRFDKLTPNSPGFHHDVNN